MKGDLRVEFGQERLTSHAGLELFRRFLRERGFAARLRQSEGRLPRRGDLRFVPLVLLVLGEYFDSFADAKEKAFDYIEIFYDQQRRHSSLDYVSPAEY